MRSTQEEAYRDSEQLRLRRASLPARILSLEEGVRAVVRAAEGRNLPESTIERTILSHARYLFRFWPRDTPLTRIDSFSIQDFIAWARSDVDSRNGNEEKKPRHPNTLRQKDLPLLKRCFKAASMPVPEIEAPRGVPVAPEFLTMEEVSVLIERMRSETFYDARGRELSLPARERHADIIQLVAQTGVRAGELSRIRPGDVSLPLATISVVEAKDRSNPRPLPIPDSLRPAVQRLFRTALNKGWKQLVPGPSTLANICSKWQKRLGEPRLNARVLRHSFCSAQFRLKVPAPNVRDLMGHKSLTTTNRYAHSVPEDLVRASSKLDEFF